MPGHQGGERVNRGGVRGGELGRPLLLTEHTRLPNGRLVVALQSLLGRVRVEQLQRVVQPPHRSLERLHRVAREAPPPPWVSLCPDISGTFHET